MFSGLVKISAKEGTLLYIYICLTTQHFLETFQKPTSGEKKLSKVLWGFGGMFPQKILITQRFKWKLQDPKSLMMGETSLETSPKNIMIQDKYKYIQDYQRAIWSIHTFPMQKTCKTELKYARYTNHLQYSLRCLHNNWFPNDLYLNQNCKTQKAWWWEKYLSKRRWKT